MNKALRLPDPLRHCEARSPLRHCEARSAVAIHALTPPSMDRFVPRDDGSTVFAP